jgi:AraC-like DNA-binding protein
MTSDGSPAPLAAHPVLRASSREDLARELSRVYGATLSAADASAPPVNAVANRVEVRGVCLHYCRYDAPVRIGFSSMSGLRQMVCLAGVGSITRGGQQLSLDGAVTGVIPPDSDFVADYLGGYQQLVLQFDEDALRRRAEAITGSPMRSELGVRFMERHSQPSRIRSIAIARALGQVLTLDGAAHGISASELADALTTAFLIENSPIFADRIAAPSPEASPTKTRILEDYIHQHWNQAITVEDIAAACGVSARSVFAQFRKHRGESPLTYQRNLRLDHARRMLLAPDNLLSVIDVAMSCGFASFGHFARRYRDRFGELPSTTRVRGELGGGQGLR